MDTSSANVLERFDTRLMHPRDQIAAIIARIYRDRLTTTSGGNISIIDDSGDIWVTPAAVDKGSLTAGDIMMVSRGGEIRGPHKPSSEFPFHRAIFARRPDIRAIIHAHPPALVAFSVVRQIPDASIIPQARSVCGRIGYAPYALPGSEELGALIAQQFIDGVQAVIMESHGVVVGGTDLLDAYERFETLEFCARTIIAGRTIGTPVVLSDADIARFDSKLGEAVPENATAEYPSDERAVRGQIVNLVRRACDQGLMISTYGTVSARWRANDFLITPRNLTRWNIQAEDVVQFRDGRREPGKLPSRSARIHQEIYRRNASINAILITQSPNVMAFTITGRRFDNRTIPESWILLQDVPILPFASHFAPTDTIAETIGPDHPALIVQNDSILVTGRSLLHAFDRLEVAEFSARSLILGAPLGAMVPINESQIADLRKKFLS